ncbi:Rhodanese-like domain-containing protein, partial [Thamnocephalis sphaerospora]
LSFYRFTPIAQEDLEPLRQRLTHALSEIGVLGRIYVATEGVNAQVTCPSHQLDALRQVCDSFPELNGVTFNLSTEHRRAFRRLAVRVKLKIVSDGMPADTYDLTREPTYLDAETWHHELSAFADRPTDDATRPVLLDTRNHYESEIGYFQGAERPDVDTFRDFLQEMTQRVASVPKDAPVYMYCTGGIRCSKAGAILRSQGWEDVRMLKGGITAYGNYVRQHPELRSLFIGKNFTFDKRLGEAITEDTI